MCLHGADPGQGVEEGSLVPEVETLLELFLLQPGSSNRSPNMLFVELHTRRRNSL